MNAIATNPSAAVQFNNVISLIEEGAQSWEKAGRIITCLRLQTPDAYEQIIKMRPWITHSLLLTLERIGEHQIYPYVLLEPKTASRWLIGYPYEEQKRACTVGVEVLKHYKNGRPVTEIKRLNELSISDARKVFGAVRLNKPEEQLQYLTTAPTAFLARGSMTGTKDSRKLKPLPTDETGTVKILANFKITLRKTTFNWGRVAEVPDNTPVVHAGVINGELTAYIQVVETVHGLEPPTANEIKFSKFKESLNLPQQKRIDDRQKSN
jgi:hypothetical protein